MPIELKICGINSEDIIQTIIKSGGCKYLGFVFQSSNLLKEFNAIENVALSRIIKGYNFPDVNLVRTDNMKHSRMISSSHSKIQYIYQC